MQDSKTDERIGRHDPSDQGDSECDPKQFQGSALHAIKPARIIRRLFVRKVKRKTHRCQKAEPNHSREEGPRSGGRIGRIREEEGQVEKKMIKDHQENQNSP